MTPNGQPEPEPTPVAGDDPRNEHLEPGEWTWFGSLTPSDTPAHHGESAPTTSAARPEHTTATDGHDRTLGIPERHLSMWPQHTHTTFGWDHEYAVPTPPAPITGVEYHARVQEIVQELRAIPHGKPPTASHPPSWPGSCTTSAPLVYARPAAEQFTSIATIARQHDLNPVTLRDLAERTGTLIARTTHEPHPSSIGNPYLSHLLGADLTHASDLLLTRTTQAVAAAYSDPDLPRLWILANALHHIIPADVFTTEPATSFGPGAQIIPTHDDLLNWPGIRTAAEHLQITAEAANTGRLWMNALTGPLTDTDIVSALGILHLTHPRTAHELSLTATTLTTSALHAILDTLPHADLTTLSDGALKAICDRNHWLLGTPTEATHQILEPHSGTTQTTDIQAALANGDTASLTEVLTRLSPVDQPLGRSAVQSTPPAAGTLSRQQILKSASARAIYDFTGHQIEPRPDPSTAYSARFPERLPHPGLRITREALLADPALDALTRPPGAQPPHLDLGL